MTAYIIVNLNIKSTDWMAEYTAPTQALVAKHGGTYLVAGGAMEKLEGDGDLPSAVVVVSFPNKEAALAFHNDPEYAPLIALRQGGADGDMILVDGAD